MVLFSLGIKRKKINITKVKNFFGDWRNCEAVHRKRNEMTMRRMSG
jgi:hypothetical protein